ncbi:hypothetical protein [Bosea sp. TND4EK4]|uniref:hypothetical protein n=1 Tax=Bosea sp. TND4EK4 TaxID=1907408 RepID=UPI0011159235|nr:hypothetical protein [Bosea sp. TND4EK4]
MAARRNIGIGIYNGSFFSHKDGSKIYLLEEATMIGRPRDAAGTDSTLVPMLIWGLVLVVVGMAFVMLFV